MLALTAACLLLVVYIGFLVISNFQSQIALRDAALHRFHQDLEKRTASLGYFFSERKHELDALSLSREISSYFVNKSLGMSEEYGLKVNLFMIQQLFDRTLADRDIQGDRIYSRIVFLNSSGKVLVDTAAKNGNRALIPQSLRGSPCIYVSQENQHPQLIMSVSCSHKRKVVGELMVCLSEETLFSHFINLDENHNLGGAGLTDEHGRLHWIEAMRNQELAAHLTPELINTLPKTGFSSIQYQSNHATHEMILAYLPIQNLNLNYLAWMPTNKVAGGLAPRRLIMGMGALAAVILAALGSILWFSAQNLILKTRFDEAAKQQDMLALKKSTTRGRDSKTRKG